MEFMAIAIICLAIGAVGVAEGWAVSKALDGTGRNPEATSKIRTNMIIGVALVETEAIYCLLIAILLIFVKMK